MVKNIPITRFLFITIIVLLSVLTFLSYEMFITGPNEEELINNTMEYLQKNMYGGDNITLGNYYEEDGVIYRIDIEYDDRGNIEELDIYVTEDGKYIFFDPPTEMV